MCLLCGDAAHNGIALTHRPAQLLGGLWWRGTFAEARLPKPDRDVINATGAKESERVAGGLPLHIYPHPSLEALKSFSDSRSAIWKGPIVALAQNLDCDHFAYFVGIAMEDGTSLPAGFETLELPEMAFASSWHGPDDGDVPAHYARMSAWLQTSGHRRATSGFAQREEYPHDVDLSLPPALRLLLPVLFPEE